MSYRQLLMCETSILIAAREPHGGGRDETTGEHPGNPGQISALPRQKRVVAVQRRGTPCVPATRQVRQTRMGHLVFPQDHPDMISPCVLGVRIDGDDLDSPLLAVMVETISIDPDLAAPGHNSLVTGK
jgi:hypothetical protein